MSRSSSVPEAQFEQLSQDLQSLGYKGLVSEGYVDTSLTGYGVQILLYPNRTIQFVSGFEMPADAPFDVNRSNAFNSTYRFSKTYLDDDQDVVLSTDFLYDWDHEDRAGTLKRMILTHELALGFLTSAFGQGSADAEQD